jgi:hypothetical protein
MSIVEISCLEVWREVSNFIEGEVSPELRERMEAHFKFCRHCFAIYQGTDNVVKLVGDGVEFDIPAGFSDRLKAKLKSLDLSH